MGTIFQAWLYGLLHWWRCPRTVEAAAADYERYLTAGAGELLVRNSLEVLTPGAMFDFARIIGYRYGLLRKVLAVRPTSEVWQPGWNRRLIRNGGGDAQRIAFRILDMVQAAVSHRSRVEPMT